MEWLLVTGRLYRQVFRRGGELAVRNWPVLGTLFVYLLIMTTGTRLAWNALGFLGGFAVGLLWAACASSFLYLVENIIRTSRATLSDFRRSFGAYLWDVVGVMFIFWLFSDLAVPPLLGLSQGPLIVMFLAILAVVFFNAVPELIYLGHCSLPQLLQESYQFIGDNWMEWFPANIALLGLLVAIDALPLQAAFVPVKLGIWALAAYFAMVVRGLLFLELRTTTHRGRAFRYRAR